MAPSTTASANRLPLTVLVAAPRGFCAGVDRAIEIVERALDRYGAPVYVRHEIVHNRFVVDGLKAKGAVFVEELDEVPDGAPLVFSAHGVPKSVPDEAQRRGLDYLDGHEADLRAVNHFEKHLAGFLGVADPGGEAWRSIAHHFGGIPPQRAELMERIG